MWMRAILTALLVQVVFSQASNKTGCSQNVSECKSITLRCGKCAGDQPCDPVSGCPGGCEMLWTGGMCDELIVDLKIDPVNKTSNATDDGDTNNPQSNADDAGDPANPQSNGAYNAPEVDTSQSNSDDTVDINHPQFFNDAYDVGDTANSQSNPTDAYNAEDTANPQSTYAHNAGDTANPLSTDAYDTGDTHNSQSNADGAYNAVDIDNPQSNQDDAYDDGDVDNPQSNDAYDTEDADKQQFNENDAYDSGETTNPKYNANDAYDAGDTANPQPNVAYNSGDTTKPLSNADDAYYAGDTDNPQSNDAYDTYDADNPQSKDAYIADNLQFNSDVAHDAGDASNPQANQNDEYDTEDTDKPPSNADDAYDAGDTNNPQSNDANDADKPQSNNDDKYVEKRHIPSQGVYHETVQHETHHTEHRYSTHTHTSAHHVTHTTTIQINGQVSVTSDSIREALPSIDWEYLEWDVDMRFSLGTDYLLPLLRSQHFIDVYVDQLKKDIPWEYRERFQLERRKEEGDVDRGIQKLMNVLVSMFRQFEYTQYDVSVMRSEVVEWLRYGGKVTMVAYVTESEAGKWLRRMFTEFQMTESTYESFWKTTYVKFVRYFRTLGQVKKERFNNLAFAWFMKEIRVSVKTRLIQIMKFWIRRGKLTYISEGRWKDVIEKAKIEVSRIMLEENVDAYSEIKEIFKTWYIDKVYKLTEEYIINVYTEKLSKAIHHLTHDDIRIIVQKIKGYIHIHVSTMSFKLLLVNIRMKFLPKPVSSSPEEIRIKLNEWFLYLEKHDRFVILSEEQIKELRVNFDERVNELITLKKTVKQIKTSIKIWFKKNINIILINHLTEDFNIWITKQVFWETSIEEHVRTTVTKYQKYVSQILKRYKTINYSNLVERLDKWRHEMLKQHLIVWIKTYLQRSSISVESAEEIIRTLTKKIMVVNLKTMSFTSFTFQYESWIRQEINVIKITQEDEKILFDISDKFEEMLTFLGVQFKEKLTLEIKRLRQDGYKRYDDIISCIITWMEKTMADKVSTKVEMWYKKTFVLTHLEYKNVILTEELLKEMKDILMKKVHLYGRGISYKQLWTFITTWLTTEVKTTNVKRILELFDVTISTSLTFLESSEITSFKREIEKYVETLQEKYVGITEIEIKRQVTIWVNIQITKRVTTKTETWVKTILHDKIDFSFIELTSNFSKSLRLEIESILKVNSYQISYSRVQTEVRTWMVKVETELIVETSTEWLEERIHIDVELRKVLVSEIHIILLQHHNKITKKELTVEIEKWYRSVKTDVFVQRGTEWYRKEASELFGDLGCDQDCNNWLQNKMLEILTTHVEVTFKYVEFIEEIKTEIVTHKQTMTKKLVLTWMETFLDSGKFAYIRNNDQVIESKVEAMLKLYFKKQMTIVKIKKLITKWLLKQETQAFTEVVRQWFEQELTTTEFKEYLPNTSKLRIKFRKIVNRYRLKTFSEIKVVIRKWMVKLRNQNRYKMTITWVQKQLKIAEFSSIKYNKKFLVVLRKAMRSIFRRETKFVDVKTALLKWLRGRVFSNIKPWIDEQMRKRGLNRFMDKKALQRLKSMILKYAKDTHQKMNINNQKMKRLLVVYINKLLAKITVRITTETTMFDISTIIRLGIDQIVSQVTTTTGLNTTVLQTIKSKFLKKVNKYQSEKFREMFMNKKLDKVMEFMKEFTDELDKRMHVRVTYERPKISMGSEVTGRDGVPPDDIKLDNTKLDDDAQNTSLPEPPLPNATPPGGISTDATSSDKRDTIPSDATQTSRRPLDAPTNTASSEPTSPDTKPPDGGPTDTTAANTTLPDATPPENELLGALPDTTTHNGTLLDATQSNATLLYSSRRNGTQSHDTPSDTVKSHAPLYNNPGIFLSKPEAPRRKTPLFILSLPVTPLSTSPLPDAPLLETPLPAAPLPKAPLPAAPLPEAPLPETPLPTAPLPAAPLPEAPLPETSLPTAPLPEATLPDAPLFTTAVPKAPLREAPLLTAPLPTAPLPTAPLPTAPLPTAPLHETSLPETSLPKAPLPEAPLLEAPLTETPLPTLPLPTAPITTSSTTTISNATPPDKPPPNATPTEATSHVAARRDATLSNTTATASAPTPTAGRLHNILPNIIPTDATSTDANPLNATLFNTTPLHVTLNDTAPSDATSRAGRLLGARAHTSTPGDATSHNRTLSDTPSLDAARRNATPSEPAPLLGHSPSNNNPHNTTPPDTTADDAKTPDATSFDATPPNATSPHNNIRRDAIPSDNLSVPVASSSDTNESNATHPAITLDDATSPDATPTNATLHSTPSHDTTRHNATPPDTAPLRGRILVARPFNANPHKATHPDFKPDYATPFNATAYNTTLPNTPSNDMSRRDATPSDTAPQRGDLLHPAISNNNTPNVTPSTIPDDATPRNTTSPNATRPVSRVLQARGHTLTPVDATPHNATLPSHDSTRRNSTSSNNPRRRGRLLIGLSPNANPLNATHQDTKPDDAIPLDATPPNATLPNTILHGTALRNSTLSDTATLRGKILGVPSSNGNSLNATHSYTTSVDATPSDTTLSDATLSNATLSDA